MRLGHAIGVAYGMLSSIKPVGVSYVNQKVIKMLVFDYASKKELKDNVGKPLRYIETSIFGAEYKDNGKLTGANRPHITGKGREFFAQVTMHDGLILKVS